MKKKYFLAIALISSILNINVAKANRKANISNLIGFPQISENLTIDSNALNYQLQKIRQDMPGVKIEFLPDKQEFKLFEPKGKYNLAITTKSEKFEKGEDLRLNKVEHVTGEKENQINLTSTTLNDQFIRSSTKCVGTTEKGTLKNNHTVYCATATPQVCEKVLKAWSEVNNVNLREVGSSSTEMKKKAQECSQLMDKYTKVLSAFGKDLTGKATLVNEREKIMEQEVSNIKNMLSQVSDGNKPHFKNINSLGTADEFAELTKELTASMSSTIGIGRLHQFIDLCLENNSKFAPTENKKIEARKATLQKLIQVEN